MDSIDTELLGQYLQQRSETAFAELVRRHVDLVYSAALRQLNGNRQHAEDATQAVFTDLARKAPSLVRHTSLAGWLYSSTRYATASIRRTESRRSLREQTAHAMNPQLQESQAEPDWEEIRPLLDEVMHDLKEEDREAILLRYFEKLPLTEVGTRLGVPDNTARMRIERAISKLRTRLAARGISSTAAALGTALAQQAVSSAPSALSTRVVQHAIEASAASGALSPITTKFWSIFGKAGVPMSITVLVLATAFLWTVRHGATEAAPPAKVSAAQPATIDNQAVPTPAAAPLKTDKPSLAGIELYFVDDQTGRAITNDSVFLRGWEKGSHTLVEKIVPLEGGHCIPPFDPGFGPGYWILTRIDGWADVMLKWQPQRGEVIPDSYIVRLVRPILIGGRVVDPSGNPVAGAEVAFGNNEIPGSDTKPESHQLARVTALTDVEGRWKMQRIAPEVLRYVSGSAFHEDFAESQRVEVSRQPEAAQQLLDGTFVFQLGPSRGVSGIVVNTQGEPVSGALVHVGMLDMTGSRDERAANDGTFTVKGCPPGIQLVTASAPGFAPAVISVNMDTNQTPVKLVLGQGKTFRARIVDQNGPIVGAHLWFNTFSQTLKGPRLPQVEFNPKSDSDGLVVWEHAPDQEMEFDCSASGHMRVSNLVLRPEEAEQTITLPMALVIRGTVRDADSMELLPRFRLGIGWPNTGPDGAMQPQWFGIDRFWPIFTGGKFEHSLEEPVVSGTTNRGYVFRFEAEGYAPQVTRAYQPDEGEVWMDIKLQKAQETLISIYTPDGHPAADAQIGLLAPGNQLQLVPGGFSIGGMENSTWLRKADVHGRFVLPTDDSVKQVAIAHPEGYLECAPSELLKSGTARLEPWAIVEGVWLVGERPAAHREVSLDFPYGSQRKLQLEHSAFTATTDENGRFVFSQVPVATLEVIPWSNNFDAPGSKSGSHVGQIKTLPGQTSEVSLSGQTGNEFTTKAASGN